MVSVQTGNMLDVVIEGKSIGLKQRGHDDVIWLPDPEGLRDVLAAEIQRLAPSTPQDSDVQVAREIVEGFIVPKGDTLIGHKGRTTILVGEGLIRAIASAIRKAKGQQDQELDNEKSS